MKLYQSSRMYVKMDGKYRWLTTPEVAEKVVGVDWEQQLREYVDDQDILNNLGKEIKEWPEKEEEDDHRTDKLYKMLYVCPWEGGNYDWLDEIQRVGFNVVHTWHTMHFPWEKANDDILNELERRGMYGCIQVPKDLGDAVLREAAIKLGKHKNTFASPFEEPDGKEHPNKEEQYKICDIIKQASPELEIWLCLDWGPWKLKISFYGISCVITDSYPFMTQHGSHPVAGTPAARNSDTSLPYWTMADIIEKKITMIKEVVPPDMPMINIGQGYYAGTNAYPDVETEWKFYNDRLGLNSFAIYPHGQGQAFPSVMTEERIRKQCKELMIKLDEGVM